MEHVIPPMCSPYATPWEQPNRDDILVSDDAAVMDAKCLEALQVYSCTIPTGVYSGKMWRAEANGQWILRWWSDEFEHEGRMVCSVEQRPIRIMDWKALMGI